MGVVEEMARALISSLAPWLGRSTTLALLREVEQAAKVTDLRLQTRTLREQGCDFGFDSLQSPLRLGELLADK